MSVPLGEIALRYALEEVRAGAREVGGNNAGPWVEKYLNAAHPGRISHTGQPWCAAFWGWCWLQAAKETGIKLPVSYTASCTTLHIQFAALGHLLRPGGVVRPGDAVFWDHAGDGTPDHVNMVYEVRGGVLWTVGGNEGSEESGAPVQLKNRGRMSEAAHLHGVGLMFPEMMP